MEKRVLLAVALCMGLIFVWPKIFPPAQPPPTVNTQIPTPKGPGGAGDKTPAANSAANSGATPAANPAAAPSTGSGQAPATVQPEELTEVSWHDGKYRAVLTSHGGAVKSFELLDKKYMSASAWILTGPDDKPEPRQVADQPTNLINSNRPALLTHFRPGEYPLPPIPAQSWQRIENQHEAQRHRVVYQLNTPDVVVTKTYDFRADVYSVPVIIEVRNQRQARQVHHLSLSLDGYQNPGQVSGGFLSAFSPSAPQHEVTWDRASKYHAANLELLRKGPDAEDLKGNIRWIGIGQKYFLLAAALGSDDKEAKQASTQERLPGSGAMTIATEYAERPLDPGQSATYHVTLFAGPKLPELLDAVQINGAPSGLNTAINYTLEILARPLLWVLRQIYHGVHNWALAIVLLTVLVKLATYYPTHKSMQSMRAMSDLKPQIDALKEKCGEDKQRFNLEMMNLYKQHGVNPLGGCLPMLLQMPVWFALYSMLGNAVELYRVPFLWISDLTSADPYLVLPLLTGALMYLQTKLSPAPPDPQQKAMTVMMPVMFTLFSLFLPAGLTLYIMTNTVLGMLQQGIINRAAKKGPVGKR